MSFLVSVITQLPQSFPGMLAQSLAGRALRQTIWTLETVQIRNYAANKHGMVDDTPAGGGPGMVMRADVAAAALDATLRTDDTRPRLLMSPRGQPLTQPRIRELAGGTGLVILCPRFEGIDERIVAARELEEISLGDFILSGGEPAALCLIDAVVRLLPGVMGSHDSGRQESFEDGLLEYPQYTRPRLFEGQAIPDILLSGDHGAVARWRRAAALRATEDRRPDLWRRFQRADAVKNEREAAE